MEENLDSIKNDNRNNASTDNDSLSNIKKEPSISKNLNLTETKLDSVEQKSINKNIDNNDRDKKLQEINIKPKKELPIEKKPFNEFINEFLLPTIIKEFKDRGLSVDKINLENTYRPIAGDKCWVIYCEIKDTCNFWLSFEKDDITSLKSISLCKSNQKPSVIESFLIDEKRITLQLIISRILQRLNGQKLIGIN